MSAHTPRPWSAGIAASVIVIRGGASSMPRTVVARVPNKGYPANAALDAALIAAAPDLLAACVEAEILLRAHHQNYSGAAAQRIFSAFENCRAAIAKAEGA